MKQLYYILKSLLRGKGSNIIKIVSLALGLFVGIILFARVAFEMSYETGYKEPDKLAVVLATYTQNGVSLRPFQEVLAPVPEAIMDAFPEEVQSATLTRYFGNPALYVGQQRFTGVAMMADERFFETMGITVTSGSPAELAVSNMVFVSEDFARKTFGTADVIGNTYIYDKNQEYTVRGTFEAVGENNSVRPDMVISIAGYPDYMGWVGGAAFQAYVRLRQPEDIIKVNQGMDAVLLGHLPDNTEDKDWYFRYHLRNMREEFISEPNRQRMMMVMSFLAFALLFIAAMNYVLIAISELPRRAKSVGIHKCNGAGTAQVFNMFLIETAIILFVSVLLAAVLVLNLQGLIENVIEVKVSSLFTLQTLWVPAVLILLVFLIAGVVPGRMFSRVPVTQVFRKYADRNSSWKKILLFIQFAGVALVFGLLIVIYSQYSHVMNYDHGYNPENIAVAHGEISNMDLSKTTLMGLPMVEQVAFSELTIGDGWSGERISNDSGKELFTTRINSISPEYITLYDIPIVEGRNVMLPGEIVVNEEFIRQMRMPAGSVLGWRPMEDFPQAVIVGVMKDFVDNTLYTPLRPVAFVYMPDDFGCISVKLTGSFGESLQKLNEEAQALFPANDVVFESFEQGIQGRYVSIKRFRNSALVAFSAILLIALIGLFGYINDEMQRRSKEIAIRKVNGAGSWSIIKLLNYEVGIVALPAVILGLGISYFIGKEWLQQFAGARIDLSIAMYVLLSIVLLLVIVASIILKSWRIANENPVVSLKSE